MVLNGCKSDKPSIIIIITEWLVTPYVQTWPAPSSKQQATQVNYMLNPASHPPSNPAVCPTPLRAYTLQP